jgi:hypothetical protein
MLSPRVLVLLLVLLALAGEARAAGDSPNYIAVGVPQYAVRERSVEGAWYANVRLGNNLGGAERVQLLLDFHCNDTLLNQDVLSAVSATWTSDTEVLYFNYVALQLATARTDSETLGSATLAGVLCLGHGSPVWRLFGSGVTALSARTESQLFLGHEHMLLADRPDADADAVGRMPCDTSGPEFCRTRAYVDGALYTVDLAPARLSCVFPPALYDRFFAPPAAGAQTYNVYADAPRVLPDIAFTLADDDTAAPFSFRLRPEFYVVEQHALRHLAVQRGDENATAIVLGMPVSGLMLYYDHARGEVTVREQFDVFNTSAVQSMALFVLLVAGLLWTWNTRVAVNVRANPTHAAYTLSTEFAITLVALAQLVVATSLLRLGRKALYHAQRTSERGGDAHHVGLLVDAALAVAVHAAAALLPVVLAGVPRRRTPAWLVVVRTMLVEHLLLVGVWAALTEGPLRPLYELAILGVGVLWLTLAAKHAVQLAVAVSRARIALRLSTRNALGVYLVAHYAYATAFVVAYMVYPPVHYLFEGYQVYWAIAAAAVALPLMRAGAMAYTIAHASDAHLDVGAQVARLEHAAAATRRSSRRSSRSSSNQPAAKRA